jgi:DNA helicase-2/ATP-dependent DNA helicase PcrA
LLSELNPQQRLAVTHGEGPALVVAGPGSGKTRVLAYRFAYLASAQSTGSDRILAVTFTNKAAREMRARVDSLLARGPEVSVPGSQRSPLEPRRLSLGTFHSLCARWLRREAARVGLPEDFVIYDEEDQEKLVREAVLEENLNPKQYHPAALLDSISRAKNNMRGPEAFEEGSAWEKAATGVYRRYEDLLRANHAVDFDDLLLLAVRLLTEHIEIQQQFQDRYQHVLVDEFQDTNAAQYQLARLLAARHRNLFAVGDADQSIYRWRGADYRNVQRFLEDFPEAQLILLEENYRSTQTVLDAAMGVIRRNSNRVDKNLFTRRGPGRPIVLHEAYDEEEEAQFVVDTIATLVAQGASGGGLDGLRPGDCAVMYRTNAQSRVLEEAFLRANLPYRLVGAQRFYGRREIKDVLAYLRLICDPADRVSLGRILNVPPRGLGERSLALLLQTSSSAGLPAAEVLIDLEEKRDTSAFASVFRGRTANALIEVGGLLRRWRERRQQAGPYEILEQVLRDTGFREYLEDGTPEGQDRWENIRELIAVSQEFQDQPLERFLEEIALVSDQDTLVETQDAPTLLTLHAAKGLEFRVVLITGLDEGLLPHSRSLEDPEAMEEERRLFYVGITRARDRLFLVRAFRRTTYGEGGVSDPSRFLRDIPASLLESTAGGLGGHSHRAFQEQQRMWEWSPEQGRQDRSSGTSMEPRFHSGLRVQHAQFGPGLVIESRIRGEDEEVLVMFDEVGLKRLDGRTAPLTILPDRDNLKP